MQEEIIKLKAENKELKSQKDIEDDIEYHVDPFITRKSDKKPIKYCICGCNNCHLSGKY